MENEFKIIRGKEARELCGMAKTTFQDRINAGLIPPNISLGERAVGWVYSEIQAVIKAMIMGKSKEEIRLLVKELLNQRREI